MALISPKVARLFVCDPGLQALSEVAQLHFITMQMMILPRGVHYLTYFLTDRSVLDLDRVMRRRLVMLYFISVAGMVPRHRATTLDRIASLLRISRHDLIKTRKHLIEQGLLDRHWNVVHPKLSHDFQPTDEDTQAMIRNLEESVLKTWAKNPVLGRQKAMEAIAAAKAESFSMSVDEMELERSAWQRHLDSLVN
jgi:hypothetical protein